MPEYIDRVPLINKLKDKIINPQTAFINYVLIELLEKAPAADVIEVVRCKDCKHYKFGKHFTDIKFCQRFPYYAEKGGLNTSDDDFCSHGERRSDNG